MNKMIKIFIIVILIIMVLLTLNPISLAISTEVDVDGYEPSRSTQNEFDDLMGHALGVVQLVGSFVSVIALVVIGIKYMIGSIEERAEYKKSMIPYVIGALFVFASSNIAKVFYDIAQNIQP